MCPNPVTVSTDKAWMCGEGDVLRPQCCYNKGHINMTTRDLHCSINNNFYCYRVICGEVVAKERQKIL